MPEVKIDYRQDPNLVTEEGFTTGELVIEKIYKNTWLIPGVTYTPRKTPGGRDVIPVLTRVKNGKPTGLGEEAQVGDIRKRNVYIDVDRKVSAQFDGVFVSAGIADLELEQQIADGKADIMAMDFRYDIIDCMLKEGVHMPAVPASDSTTPVQKVAYARKEFYKQNGEQATFIVASVDFAYELDMYITHRLTTLGDDYVSSVYLGNIKDLMVFQGEINQTVDFFMGNEKSLHIKVPANVIDIGDKAIVGAVPDDQAFDGGVVTLNDTNARSAVVTTFIHYFYGRKIPFANKLVYYGESVPATDSVTITSMTVTNPVPAPGATVTANATVQATGKATADVVYTLLGALDSKTTINANVVTIGADEPNDNVMYVRTTSVFDNTVYAEAEMKVTSAITFDTTNNYSVDESDETQYDESDEYTETEEYIEE